MHIVTLACPDGKSAWFRYGPGWPHRGAVSLCLTTGTVWTGILARARFRSETFAAPNRPWRLDPG